jgi:hypothetical protein
MAYGTLKADVIQSDTTNVPPQFNGGNGVQVGTLCRAWVNFNGTGTVAIRASFNVSSITDNGTGDYTVNFTRAMSDSSYAACVNSDSNSGLNFSQPISLSTGSFQFTTRNGAGTYFDGTIISVSVFR